MAVLLYGFRHQGNQEKVLTQLQQCFRHKTESEEAALPGMLSLHFTLGNTCRPLLRPSSEVAGRCTEAAESSAAAAAPAPPAEVLSLRSANRPIERETFSFCISEVTAATAKWYQFGTIHTLRPHQSYNSSDLAKNVGCLQNGSHMLLSLLASFCKTSMKQDKSMSTEDCLSLR